MAGAISLAAMRYILCEPNDASDGARHIGSRWVSLECNAM